MTTVYEALLEVENKIKTSGISTYYDHIPEWHNLIDSILKYDLSQDDVYGKTCLKDSLQYYKKIQEYFSSNKPIQADLEKLFKIIKEEINKNNNKPKF